MANFQTKTPRQSDYDADQKRLADQILALQQQVKQLEAKLLQLSRTAAVFEGQNAAKPQN